MRGLLAVVLVSFLAAAEEPFDARLGDLDRDGWTALVTLPSNYDTEPERRFPTIWLLHGAGGTAASWAQLADLRALADRHQRIIVCASCGGFSWYADREEDGVVVQGAETDLLTRALPSIDERYRTTPDRWLTGLSMGGFGALHLGIGRPDLFSAIGALSPCVRPSRWESRWGLLKALGPVAGRERYDIVVTAAMRELLDRPLSLLCGRDDFFHRECLDLHRALAEAGIEHQWVDDAVGQHDGHFWAAWLPQQLDWFALATQAATATP